MGRLKLLFFSFLLCAGLLIINGPAEAVTTLDAKYIMAFHACNTTASTCSDPQNHKVYIAQSEDGISWSLLSGHTPHSGSVPDLIRRGNTLYVYTPGMVRRYLIDTATWKDSAPVPVSLKLSSGESEEFVDPSPILDDNGSIVLFYLVGQRGGDPARCQSGQTSCTKTFRSATEVSGGDGASFIVDTGNRAEINITSSGSGSDPDIFKGPEGFLMYVARDGGVQALSSNDLRGSYQNSTGLSNGMLVAAGMGSVPAGYYNDKAKEYWTYVHKSQGTVASIRRAVHSSLNTAIPEASFSTIISGTTFPDSAGLGSSYTVESPGFELNTTNICVATLSSSAKLHLPVLTFGGQYFWLDLQYVTDTLDFTLIDYGEISVPANFSSCSSSNLAADLSLHIPVLFYNDVSYWADFQYQQGATFSLTGADKN